MISTAPLSRAWSSITESACSRSARIGASDIRSWRAKLRSNGVSATDSATSATSVFPAPDSIASWIVRARPNSAVLSPHDSFPGSWPAAAITSSAAPTTPMVVVPSSLSSVKVETHAATRSALPARASKERHKRPIPSASHDASGSSSGRLTGSLVGTAERYASRPKAGFCDSSVASPRRTARPSRSRFVSGCPRREMTPTFGRHPSTAGLSTVHEYPTHRLRPSQHLIPVA